jgi:hypothetical protein
MRTKAFKATPGTASSLIVRDTGFEEARIAVPNVDADITVADAAFDADAVAPQMRAGRHRPPCSAAVGRTAFLIADQPSVFVGQ